MLKEYIFILLASSCIIQIHGRTMNEKDDGGDHYGSSIKVKRQAAVFSDPSDDLPDPEDDQETLCDNSTVDAIYVLRDETVYIFRASAVWKTKNDKVEKGFPKAIHVTFPGLEDHLDAAFSDVDDGVYFFKGSQCWKYYGNKLENGYPKNMEEVFPGVPSNIQAATRWGTNGYIYFFKGDKYWRFHPNQIPQVKSTYPKLIGDVFRGIPDNLDDALLYTNGNTYFFKGIRYWRLNDETLSDYVERSYHIPYPRLTAPWWLSCKPEP